MKLLKLNSNKVIEETNVSVVSQEDLEQYLAWDSSENNDFYTSYTYDVDGLLTNVDIWTDNTETTKIFAIVVTYNVDDTVDTVVTTRVSSGLVLTKALSYTVNGDLESITYTQT